MISSYLARYVKHLRENFAKCQIKDVKKRGKNKQIKTKKKKRKEKSYMIRGDEVFREDVHHHTTALLIAKPYSMDIEEWSLLALRCSGIVAISKWPTEVKHFKSHTEIKTETKRKS